jgi:lysine-N-methylase
MPIAKVNPEADDRQQVSHPSYAAAFQCIGPACEDPCCGEWDIPLDHATYAKYQRFPEKKLRALVSHFVTINPPGSSPGLYAQIRLGPSRLCPFWDSDQLCSIQKEHGPQLLSATCSIYPRSLSRVDGVLEGTLSLSCPEAVRNVLLNPGFLEVTGDLHSGAFRTDNSHQLARNENGAPRKPYRSFPAVRARMVEMVRDRSRPLAERLLAIGSLCQQLQRVLDSKGDDAVPAFLGSFRDSPGARAVDAAFESLPANPALKLEVVLKLADDRLREATCGKRFREVFFAFVEGIATADSSLSGDDIGCLRYAERNWYQPFFERSPHILENYLLNSMLQNLFPAGRETGAGLARRSMFDEFLLLSTQFAWINAVLVGVAGRYKESFAAEHVVEVVQSFTREVEHYPPVLHSILESIKSRKLGTLEGMSLLLRSWNG